MSYIEKREKKLPAIWVMVFTLTFWILIYALQWEIVELLTPFLIVPFYILCFILTCTVVIICLVRIIITLAHSGFSKHSLAGLIIIALFIVSIFLPLDVFYEKSRFFLLSNQYDAAVSEIIELNPEEGLFPLPAKYTNLSRGGGEIIICGNGNRRAILFYSFRGILDNFSVYAYTPNDQAYESLMKYESWFQIVQVRENWYFCASR